MQHAHHRSFWLQEALAADSSYTAPALEADSRADVCIVGGGYTGLWTALHLKEAEPALDIVLLERDICGAGASGRNAGFLMSWWVKFLALCTICGEAEALRLARASDAAIGSIHKFCIEHGIDIDFRHDGWLWAATNASQRGLWVETMEAVARHGDAPFVTWTPAQVAARSGSAAHIAGVVEHNAARVQPALLARGLRRVALERGIRIFENTPLQDLAAGAPARVRTPRASVTADKVVVAMNAWAIRWADIRKAMVVVSGDIIVTPPIPHKLAELGWNDGLTVSDGRTLLHYYRTTRDGRLAFGKGGMSGQFVYGGKVGDVVEGPSQLSDYLFRACHALYPAISDVGVAASWRGPVDRTRSGLPFFSRLDGHDNVFFGAGFSGLGIGPSHVGGRILAALALERQDEWSTCPLVRPPRRDFPPEPLRYIGSNIIRHALLAKDRAEDEGREPSLPVRWLAGLAPAGVSPFAAKQES